MTGRGHPLEPRRVAPWLPTLALALAPLVSVGCRGRSAPAGAAASASAPVASASVPLVVQCYQGCLDLNKGKPVDQEEVKKNCAYKCARICSKACAVPRQDVPYEKAMEECGVQCKQQLGAPPAAP